MEKYVYKAILTPKILEEYYYSKSHFRDYKMTDYEIAERRESVENSDYHDNSRKNLYRSLVEVRGIVNANIGIWNQAKYVTLTFKENLRDVKKANNIFNLFIKRLKYKHFQGLKYICVVEFQKRGAVHYHLLMNMPFIDKKVLTKIWGQGKNLKIRTPYNNIKNWGAYFSKHGTKATQAGFKELVGQKKYFCSRGLLRPDVIYEEKQYQGLILQEKEFITQKGEKIKYRQTLLN